MSTTEDLPLRERKKRQTRQAISDAATELFAERGFESVTIDEVAAAANVSKGTVFNYFTCKEDLLFDEVDAAEARLVRAVRERAPDESIVAAVRRHVLAATERMCSGERPWIDVVARLVAASPALQAREGQIYDRFALTLAGILREETGAREGDCRPYVAAHALVGVQRAVVESARVRVLAGRNARLAPALLREAERGFALLEHGLPTLTSR